jgi:hypothetical protein
MRLDTAMTALPETVKMKGYDLMSKLIPLWIHAMVALWGGGER